MTVSHMWFDNEIHEADTSDAQHGVLNINDCDLVIEVQCCALFTCIKSRMIWKLSALSSSRS